MRTQYYAAASLDGFIATSEDSLEWLFPLGDINQTSYPLFIQEVGALAMGSVTYEWMLRHVIKSGTANPGRWPYAQPTWVFSSRELPGIPDADIRFVKGDVRPVHDLMRQAAKGRNLWLVGGGELVGRFHDAGLLDDIIVQVGSVTLGSGKPLLPRRIISPPLKLVAVRNFGEGFAELRYEVPRMEPGPIRFKDGAGYERYMGKWSQLAGDTFLDWLAPKHGLRWLDVGCGNGAFTEMLVERCAPESVDGIDPSEEQLAFARARPATRDARYRQGDAMALPYPDAAFDAAVMPLVIFFVPDPAKGVAEMARVVRPGGSVTAYAWDMAGGGFPYDALIAEMRGMGVDVPKPPSPEASRIESLRELWTGAGLTAVETREIAVQRTFMDFDDFWTTILAGPSVGPKLAKMTSGEITILKERMRARLPADGEGRITYGARANAVKGIKPESR
jgi:SAM-dependent methyltransferase